LQKYNDNYETKLGTESSTSIKSFLARSLNADKFMTALESVAEPEVAGAAAPPGEAAGFEFEFVLGGYSPSISALDTNKRPKKKTVVENSFAKISILLANQMKCVLFVFFGS
jgi:hypothetical protein